MRYISSSKTASEMIKDLTEGTEEGKDFCSSILRLASERIAKKTESNHSYLKKDKVILSDALFVQVLKEKDINAIVYSNKKASEMIKELEKNTKLADSYKREMMNCIEKMIIALKK
jgi:hypothetical protein